MDSKRQLAEAEKSRNLFFSTSVLVPPQSHPSFVLSIPEFANMRIVNRGDFYVLLKLWGIALFALPLSRTLSRPTSPRGRGE